MYYLNLITELWTLSRSSFLLYTQEKKKSFGERSLQNIPQYLQNPESPWLPVDLSFLLWLWWYLTFSISRSLIHSESLLCLASDSYSKHQGIIIRSKSFCQDAFFCICTPQQDSSFPGGRWGRGDDLPSQPGGPTATGRRILILRDRCH